MANLFYVPGNQRAERVKDLFATIARRYDLINDLQSFGLHRRWKRRMLQMAEVKPGERALDLCCGTGDIAFGLVQRGAETIGLDFSPRMLDVAQAKSRRSFCRLPLALYLLRGDAQRLPFPAGCFEIVTIGYGLRNLADWKSGLSEMQRVAKPGGRLLVLDFAKPENPIWRALYFCYLKWCVPILGRIFCGDAAAYAYILESLKHYPAQHGVAEGMREDGLIDVRVIEFLGGMMSINYGRKEGSEK